MRGKNKGVVIIITMIDLLKNKPLFQSESTKSQLGRMVSKKLTENGIDHEQAIFCGDNFFKQFKSVKKFSEHNKKLIYFDLEF